MNLKKKIFTILSTISLGVVASSALTMALVRPMEVGAVNIAQTQSNFIADSDADEGVWTIGADGAVSNNNYWFDHTNFLLYNHDVNLLNENGVVDYSVSATFKSTKSIADASYGAADQQFRGLLIYYVDLNNYIRVNMQWVRELTTGRSNINEAARYTLYGKINGTFMYTHWDATSGWVSTEWCETWADNPNNNAELDKEVTMTARVYNRSNLATDDTNYIDITVSCNGNTATKSQVFAFRDVSKYYDDHSLSKCKVGAFARSTLADDPVTFTNFSVTLSDGNTVGHNMTTTGGTPYYTLANSTETFTRNGDYGLNFTAYGDNVSRALYTNENTKYFPLGVYKDTNTFVKGEYTSANRFGLTPYYLDADNYVDAYVEEVGGELTAKIDGFYNGSPISGSASMTTTDITSIDSVVTIISSSHVANDPNGSEIHLIVNGYHKLSVNVPEFTNRTLAGSSVGLYVQNMNGKVNDFYKNNILWDTNSADAQLVNMLVEQKGGCDLDMNELEALYNAASEAAKEHIIDVSNGQVVTVSDRYNYLMSQAGDSQGALIFALQNNNNTIVLTIIISSVLPILAFAIILSNKKRAHK